MTRTILSIRFVLILATVIGIRGEDAPRDATLTIMSDFEDGLSDREFRVDYAGFAGERPIINIYKIGDANPKVKYTVEKDAGSAQMLYFKLKEADATPGSYQVEVCTSNGITCSARRDAVGKVLGEGEKQPLSCIKGKGDEEDTFHRFVDDVNTEDFSLEIKSGKEFLNQEELKQLPAYDVLKPKSNPTFVKVGAKNVFYTAVWYDGKTVKKLFEKISEDGKKVHGYCSRKYIFWASAQIVDQTTKLAKRRFRGTIIVTESLANRFILASNPSNFPVEFVRHDEESDPLPRGTYDVSVSFCASDKDVINSSVCSQATYTTLEIDGEQE